MLELVRIVLINTSHPGNIGAAARAMKTMGLSRLYLVNPKDFPCAEASVRASGADDVLEGATVCATLEEALADCTLVVGTTARERAISAPSVEPREFSERVIDETRRSKAEIALVFGRERSGLTNEEIDRCQLLVHIPANKEYSSLNLGAAVQVLSYELRMTALAASRSESGSEDEPALSHSHPLERRANFQELESFYAHLEKVLLGLGFLSQTNPVLILRRLRCLYDRAEPTVRELNILRGVLSATQEHIPASDSVEENTESE